MRAILALTLAVGCGTADDDTLPPPPTLPNDGQKLVVDRILTPTSPEEVVSYGADLDGDDIVDNYLGTNLRVIDSALDVDFNQELREAVEARELLHLLMFAADETGEFADTGRLFLGEIDGTGALAIRDGAPTGDASFGEIRDGQVELDRGDLTIDNVLFARIQLTLREAQVRGELTAEGFDGVIAGGIDEVDQDRLRRALAQGVVDDDALDECTAESEPCCPPDSRGELFVDLFDTDDDCVITFDEAIGNDIIETVTAPDVDLDGDGIDDHLSFGIAVQAVPAEFDVP